MQMQKKKNKNKQQLVVLQPLSRISPPDEVHKINSGIISAEYYHHH